MTARLIALMSLVLILTLAAFALLMGHHNQRVMSEVEQIVAEVGRGTLRELRIDGLIHDHSPARVAFLQHFTPGAPPVPLPAADMSRERRWIAEALAAEPEGPAPVDGRERVLAWVFTAGEKPHRLQLDLSRKTSPAAGQEVAVEKLAAAGAASGEGQSTQVFVRVEEVRTEDDPARGLVLKFPVQRHLVRASAIASKGAEALDSALVEDILLPVPMDELKALTNTTRKRSVYLFLGVLALGTVLTSAFAHRFTRPIRRLDNGINRLSDGDLDATVEVRSGNDEIARLGRAFNAMAGRLRAGREREREMSRREKLAALGRLAAGVAHDVRNPLHSIGLTLQHLEETCRPEADAPREEFDRSLGLIRNEIGRLDQLVSNFLGFARSERRERATIDAGELCREVARLVEREADRRGVELQVEIGDDLPQIAGDIGAIRSAVLNLVLNSFEATSDGGRVTLAAARDGASLVIEVVDTGCGIAEADQERVFDIDYTTREDGHGLGLAMVHQVVVEDHGGRVSLTSRSGRGTTVRLVLPTSATPAASS